MPHTNADTKPLPWIAMLPVYASSGTATRITRRDCGVIRSRRSAALLAQATSAPMTDPITTALAACGKADASASSGVSAWE